MPAIEEMIARGRSINVTLIFSLERYAEVAEAYVRGLERFVQDGGDLTTPASVASFFVSRVDTEADKRLDEVGGQDELKRLRSRMPSSPTSATRRSSPASAGKRWRRRWATPQRCLWASTSTKNPAYRDVMYVEELIGPMTVTMPEETIRAFHDHGDVAPTLEQGIDEAKDVFERIAEAGVDYDDVVATLEREGVEKFADSFSELLEGIRAKAGELVAA